MTVFEAFHKPGGVLVYGIPEFRLPKAIVAQEVNFLERLGVKLVCDQVVGRTITVDELFEEGYDAVFIAVGAGLPTFLDVPGKNLIGIYSANEYLTRANLMKAYRFPEYDTPIIRGKNVVTLGAGNVAMDSARTALRLGARALGSSIGARERRYRLGAKRCTMPKKKGSNSSSWPPRPDSSEMNGDALSAWNAEKMCLGEPDESGRCRPVPMEDSEFELECDLVIVAVGAGANPLLTRSTPGLELNKWGYVKVDEKTGKTTKKGVWAGGDIVTGSATVILAMGAGRVAADSIQDYLTWGW